VDAELAGSNKKNTVKKFHGLISSS